MWYRTTRNFPDQFQTRRHETIMALQLRPNCEYCDKDLLPTAMASADLLLRVHVLRGLRGDKTPQCMPELRRRLCAEADPAGAGMAAGINSCAAAAVGQACSSVVQRRRYRHAFGPYQEYSARGALTYDHRHCEFRTGLRADPDDSLPLRKLDCFASLAMTVPHGLFGSNRFSRPVQQSE
jgi:hypothetical protein